MKSIYAQIVVPDDFDQNNLVMNAFGDAEFSQVFECNILEHPMEPIGYKRTVKSKRGTYVSWTEHRPELDLTYDEKMSGCIDLIEPVYPHFFVFYGEPPKNGKVVDGEPDPIPTESRVREMIQAELSRWGFI